MRNQITDIGNFGYEIHKNGKFWKTYIYKKDTNSNYTLINTIRTLIEPEIKMILENINKSAATTEQQFSFKTSTVDMIR